jgi:hypothetical protein
VNWQVDIPNFASLVARLGAEGLKKLQLSGLDIHTVGCLLALGEITPASVAFRSTLQTLGKTSVHTDGGFIMLANMGQAQILSLMCF